MIAIGPLVSAVRVWATRGFVFFALIVLPLLLIEPYFEGDPTSPVEGEAAVAEQRPMVLGANPAPNKYDSHSVNAPVIPTVYTATDPDPLVNCQSKTGDKLVRRSACQTYTDCPDGYGGYIFESQDACKRRWDEIAAKLGGLNRDFTRVTEESNQLQVLQRELNAQQAEARLQQYVDEGNHIANDFEVKELDVKLEPPAISTVPRPTSQQGGRMY